MWFTILVLGFRISGFGSGVWGSGFGVWGLGFRVWGLGLRVKGKGLRAECLRSKVIIQGFEFWVSGFGPRFRISSLGGRF